MTVVFSDPMLDIKDWLVADPDLAPLHSGRVFFKIPTGAAFPLLRLYRVGGGTRPGEFPQQDVRIGLEIWGGADEQYTAVRELVTALESSVHQVANVVSGSTLIQGGEVTGMVDSPDPDTGFPRMVGTADFSVRLA